MKLVPCSTSSAAAAPDILSSFRLPVLLIVLVHHQLPLVSRSSSESSASPKVSSTPAGLSGAQVYPYTSHRQQQVSAPPPATPPLTRHVSPPSIPSTGVSGGRTAKTGTAPYVPPPGLETPSSVGLAPSEESPWSGLPRPSPLNHRMGRVPVSTPSVPHQQQQQTIAPSSIGAELKFGACVDEAPVALGTAKTLSAAELGMGGPGELAGVMPLASAVARPAPNPVPAAADELSELLAKLNMTKYRPKFDSKQVGWIHSPPSMPRNLASYMCSSLHCGEYGTCVKVHEYAIGFGRVPSAAVPLCWKYRVLTCRVHGVSSNVLNAILP